MSTGGTLFFAAGEICVGTNTGLLPLTTGGRLLPMAAGDPEWPETTGLNNVLPLTVLEPKSFLFRSLRAQGKPVPRPLTTRDDVTPLPLGAEGTPVPRPLTTRADVTPLPLGAEGTPVPRQEGPTMISPLV